jgi:hypothetical protein
MPKADSGEVERPKPNRYFILVTTCNYPGDPTGQGRKNIRAEGATEAGAQRAAWSARDNHFAFHDAANIPRCTPTLGHIELIAPGS